ncbi:hypothetical protein NKG05_03505 [Oerskovia sp. M15]
MVASRYADAPSDGDGSPGWSHPLVLDLTTASAAASAATGEHGLRDWLRAHPELIDRVDLPGDGRDVDLETDLVLLDPQRRSAR